MRAHLRALPRWVWALVALWSTALVSHAVLLRQLADRTHAAAMLTAPTDATLIAGVLLVAVRIALYVLLPMATLARAAFAMGLGASRRSADDQVG